MLLVFELLQFFVKTLTADDNYSLCNIWNLEELYQMQLSKKQKKFSRYFSPSLKSPSHFQHFVNKSDFHRLCISEITDCEGHGLTNI